ncbi:MAG: ATP-binding protein [Gemmatimonadaceae bacterium]
MKLAQRLTLSTTVLVAVIVGLAFVVIARRNPTASRLDLVLVAFGTVAVVAAAHAIVSRSIARSVGELRESARAIASGNYSLRPSLTVDGELGELADALRRLSEQSESKSEALRAEEALQVALTESLNEGVVVVNARQQVVRINETARTLLRLKDAVPFSADFLPRDRTLRETLETALAGQDASPAEARVDDRTLSATARPLVGGGAVLALYDLTPFRKLEAVRRDFVANVSHELRTPLTIISGFVETLQDENIPPELRQQFLAMTGGNVRRMQRIVDDLLDLSRIESGGWLPDAAEIDLQPVMNEIILGLKDSSTKENVSVESALGDDARSAYVDATAVRQVLTNLAENALRHTSHGSVQLFSERDEDGVWIGVRDTGSGIGAEHLTRIFERFYRADPSRSREAGGTGLGLSIVKHLAEAHGGRVRAESEVDKGTTIAAWFPIAPA